MTPLTVRCTRSGCKNRFERKKTPRARLYCSGYCRELVSEAQIEFIAKYPGCVHVATSSWEAKLFLKECEERTNLYAKGLKC